MKNVIDSKGHLIGKEVDGKMLDGKGHLVAKVVKGSNLTVDRKGHNRGSGDQRLRVLGEEENEA